MNYLLFGKQKVMIKKRLARLLKENHDVIDEFSVTYYDFNKDDFEDILLAVTSLPFIYDKKSVVIENASFLKTKLSEKLMPLFDAIKENNDQIDCYFIYPSDDISDKNEIFQFIKENGKISELSDLKKEDWPKYIKKYFQDKKYEIEDKAIEELSLRVGGDLYRFISEADKLMSYKIKEQKITILDVATLVSRPLEDKIFNLANALYKLDNALALSIYRDLKVVSGYEFMNNVVAMLANQFRFLSEVLFLHERGVANKDIATRLKTNEYRIQMSIRNASKLSKETISSILTNLYELDLQTKSGQLDRNFAIEMFIIRFPNKIELLGKSVN